MRPGWILVPANLAQIETHTKQALEDYPGVRLVRIIPVMGAARGACVLCLHPPSKPVYHGPGNLICLKPEHTDQMLNEWFPTAYPT